MSNFARTVRIAANPYISRYIEHLEDKEDTNTPENTENLQDSNTKHSIIGPLMERPIMYYLTPNKDKIGKRLANDDDLRKNDSDPQNYEPPVSKLINIVNETPIIIHDFGENGLLESVKLG
jgi:hypothetical protein